MYKNRKPLIIGILCVLVVVMAIGFALLREQLTITGSSHIDSNWNIRITNIRVKTLNSAYPSGDNASADVSGSTGCTTNTAPCDSTSANFDAKLITPGDYIVYEVTVTNSGNLDGVVSSINLTPQTGSNDAIQVTKSGLGEGDKITKAGGTNTIDVTVTYNSSTTSQPATTTTNITLTLNYQQDLSNSQSGQGGSESGNGGSGTTAFDTTTGTGTIYRYLNTNDESVTETQYLSINENIEEYINDSNNSWEWSTDPSTFNSIHYLKHDVENFEITASYACFIADGTEHCMQGGDSSYYQANVGILQGVQNWFTNPTQGGSCVVDASDGSSNCYGAGFGGVNVYSSGIVNASASGVYCRCHL